MSNNDQHFPDLFSIKSVKVNFWLAHPSHLVATPLTTNHYNPPCHDFYLILKPPLSRVVTKTRNDLKWPNMTLNDVNNAASTKSGSDRTGPDRIGLDCSFRFAYITWFSIWFSVFVKNSNGISKFFPVCLRSKRQLSIKRLHWSQTAAKRKCYWEECVTKQMSPK